MSIYPRRFRRIRFWFAWLFGGNFYHPKRGCGWLPSLRRRTINWKTENWYKHRTWWDFVKPPAKLSPIGMQLNRERDEYRQKEERKLNEFFMGGK